MKVITLKPTNKAFVYHGNAGSYVFIFRHHYVAMAQSEYVTVDAVYHTTKRMGDAKRVKGALSKLQKTGMRLIPKNIIKKVVQYFETNNIRI